MEIGFLYWLQGLHNPAADGIITVVFNTLVGAKGQLWVILGIVLLLFKQTRRTGIMVIVSYLIAYGIGDGILKDLIARPRPCAVDAAVPLLIARPSSFSCPSVHTMLAFASATAILLHHRKAGIATLVFATLVGLSRLYFFVHYPTDVLLGAVLGAAVGLLVCRVGGTVIDRLMGTRERSK